MKIVLDNNDNVIRQQCKSDNIIVVIQQHYLVMFTLVVLNTSKIMR